jgi:uncharacterized protein (TIGR00369 family)
VARTIPSLDQLNAWGRNNLPGLVGFEVNLAEPGRLQARMKIRPELLAPNGYLHAASVIALADSACGYGTMLDLPEGASGFTTIELKSNFLASILDGVASCVAERVHHGRTTQVWDATVRAEGSEKTLALFRCTQMILYKLRT